MKYGLDFSSVQPGTLGERELDDAIFFPFTLSPEVEYTVNFNTWIVDRKRRSRCYENRDGGFTVAFTKDRRLFGSYGKEDGIPVTTNDVVVYGFYSIPLFRNGKSLLMRYSSASPARLETNDGFFIINCDLFNKKLGKGTAQGVGRITPVGDGEMFRVTIRNLFTFPVSPVTAYYMTYAMDY